MNLKNLLIIFLTANVLFSQNVVWETEFDFIKSNSSPRGIDLNQDGIEDIVLSGGVDGLPSPYGAMAINGANGEILWTKENGNEWFLSAQHFDQNGDFIPDLLFGGRDAELQLIDGSNGNLIWEFWGNEDNPNDYGWYNFYNPQIISDINFNGYEDILCANGGDHSLDAIETDRPPGHIMILDGMNGSILKSAVVPDSNETYMSPIITDMTPYDGSNSEDILFGTGGETIEGNLWIVKLEDLLSEDLSNATPLLSNSDLGIIAPPSLTFLNNDQTLDIVVQSFDGKITAIDGNSLETMWQIDIPGTESSASPIIGNFTEDDHSPDVFATLYVGAESSYSDFYQILINGKTGEIEYMDSIGSFNFVTPIAYDSNGNGKDEVLISITNSTDGEWEHELILIDFMNNTTNSLYNTEGGDVWSTPYIKDVDGNGLADLIFTTQLNNPFVADGIKVTRIETDYAPPPFITSWGSYMGYFWDGVGGWNDYSIISNGTSSGCDFDLFAFPTTACPAESNGSVNLAIGPNSTGTPPYSYYWSNGQTSEDLSNVSAGSYSLMVYDSNECLDTISIVIPEYESIIFSQPPSCPGGSDGWAYMSSTGCSCNSSNCQFTWTVGDSIIAQGDGSNAVETYKYLYNLSAGTYTSIITHPNGCILQEDIIVPEADPLILDFSIINDCENTESGSIEISPINSDIFILWDNGTTEFLIDNLSAGNYSAVVSDSICSDSLFFEVSIEFLDECGNCDEDTSNDCVLGCTDSAACNYDTDATDNDNSCTYLDGICESCENGEIINNDSDDDGICNADELAGCQDLIACNYNPDATDDDNSCIYLDGICESCENEEIINNDSDDDNICNDIDNCPEVYNPNQEDFDSDNIGDACDGIGLNEEKNKRILIKVVDVLGKEIYLENKKNLLLFLYDDGSVEKKYQK